MNCDKKAFRKEMIEKRIASVKDCSSCALANNIRQLEEYKRAKNVMIYLPVKNEADVSLLINDTDKTFLVPVMDGDDIYACHLTMQLKIGRFDICEPVEKVKMEKDEIDLVIVPGVAFDKKYNRMGYGKGYYDRFLKDMRAFKIGACHSFQLVDEIPSEPHDIKMDMIVTEREVWSRESI